MPSLDLDSILDHRHNELVDVLADILADPRLDVDDLIESEEHHFSGIKTDSLGRKRKYVDGKEVPMGHDDESKHQWTTQSAVTELQNGIFNSKLGGYSEINANLRGQKSSIPKEEMEAVTKAIDSGFKPLDKETRVYRGVRNIPSLANLKVGDVFSDHAYLSTSLDKKATARFAEKLNLGDKPYTFTIDLPKGTPVIHVETVTGQKAGLGRPEKEVLLPRQTRLKVLSIKPGKIHCQVIIEESVQESVEEFEPYEKA